MKTIFYQIVPTSPATEMQVTGETEKSYVLGFGHNHDTEICVKKSQDGKKWFWTKEQADAAFAAQVEIQAKLNELQKQLETYEV